MMVTSDNVSDKNKSDTTEVAGSAIGCSHYKIKAKIRAKCCGKLYWCRLCHDKEELHEMDRFDVDEMECQECNSIQPIGQTCKDCGVKVASYYCDICKLLTHDGNEEKNSESRKDNEEKPGVFHCNERDDADVPALPQKHNRTKRTQRAYGQSTSFAADARRVQKPQVVDILQRLQDKVNSTIPLCIPQVRKLRLIQHVDSITAAPVASPSTFENNFY
ncbi:RING finger and CHY zinc finger domain-containing protein 1 [Smittium culicis]|uniref:RING finger and CHY zinc finger domain-containing protein 1 n=1 Tax=Smittium culicis TaxID=133412 RepID=A0A1R1Y6U1_9FUNG|nr:RING finger and CHY zinc finger domain-containing protein 1 [Smittium culicis]OMJ22619.1 RING finger and CHY zinc finger domain-containing protein 1 [Smittium culicis]